MTNNINDLSGDKMIEACELRGISILRAASQIYTKEFFKFLIVNLVLAVSFLLILFFFIINYGDVIGDSVVGFTKDLYLHRAMSSDSIATLLMLLLFWIFFSWLRSSYLVAANGYFLPTKPLSGGLLKVVSFMMVELIRLVMSLVGLILLPLLPFFLTRYYLAPAILAVQNEGGIDAMFESKQYVDGRMMKTMRCALFINLFILATILSCGLITNLIINRGLIFWSLNLLLFIFVFLPLHTCCRLVLFKKLKQLSGELRVKAGSMEKFWFIFLRLALITAVVVATFVLANDKFSGAFDSVLWFMLQFLAG